jgi:hypothetical protein
MFKTITVESIRENPVDIENGGRLLHVAARVVFSNYLWCFLG